MRITIACGGSGGHIFPAIALAEGIKKKLYTADIMFIGSNKTLDKRIFEREGYRYALLSANKLPFKKSLAILPFIVKFLFDVLKSLWMLIGRRADIVVGFGGYTSSPVVLAAYILRIRTVIHEQNVVPGRANTILLRYADRIAVSFKETRRYLGCYEYKAVYTGNPIRISMQKREKRESLKALGLDADKFTILVIGGSQGAHNLNKSFLKALAQLKEDMRSSLQVIHITGISDYEWATEAYRDMAIDSRTYSFMDRIEEAYSASDLVVTRSGASAIFEIAYFGKPMILIPYPFAMSHQAENARIFSAGNAAIQIDEKELSPNLMRDKIEGLLNDKASLRRMGESARRLSVPDSSYNLAEEVISTSKV